MNTRQDLLPILQAVRAYVPRLILEQVLAASDAEQAGREERFAGAVLFADVSGFTAMSESLAQLGKEGAEELTRVLNRYFSTMIEIVEQFDGQVIKFGGDAITCAFISDDAQGEGVLRAGACGLAMQEAMARFHAVETRGGTFELRMKIGISAGPLLFVSVGDPAVGLEYVLAGHPLDQMAAAEHHATAGEVVVDGECLTERARRGLVLSAEREGFFPVERVRQAVEPTGGGEPPLDGLDEETLRRVIARLVPYLPPMLYEQILDGQPQFIGEHRQVVSLFVNFAGLDYGGDREAGRKLQQYFTAMQEVINRYGGRLNRVITGDKGSLLHLIFGAPVAHEDNEARAVRCALDMQARVRQGEDLAFITNQKIGIASGYVFAGNVGSERRREYTVMGDDVNLSARLMQAAGEWEILMEERTARRVEEEFVCTPLPPIRVKGKHEPIAIYRPEGVREEPRLWGRSAARRRATPIVGREAELARAREIIEKARAGQGQLLVISGEAGVGKSRFLEEVVAIAHEKDAYGVGGDCLSYGSQSPYLPWIGFFTTFFGLGTGQGSVEEKVTRIRRRMTAADPALADWVPLMAQLLGLPVPDNELTAALDAQLRKQRTFDLTLTLIRHQAQQVGLFLIVFEDVHWIDSISLEMLNHVARNIGGHRILLVALHRPTIELEEWRRYPYFNRVELSDLSAEDALHLMESRLQMSPVPEQLRQRVLRGDERVNPFFVEEVINSLLDQRYLVPREGGGYELVGDLSQVEIPDSVQTLVMSRIDRLDESSKLTIKVASVIGRTFQYRPLRYIYPVEISDGKLRRNLERLSALDLTPLDRPAPEWEYMFKHITTQEVAYESLLYAHRRALHHRMGEYLEQEYGGNLQEYYELLAHHYSRSGDDEKSWDYLVKAGDDARAKYANEAAIAHYQHALSLDVEREDKYRVYESLGDVYRLIGQYEQALTSYRAALDARPPTPAHIADIRRKIAKTWELQGRYEEAMNYLDLTKASLEGEHETLEMARIYSDMGWIARRRGEYEESLRLCAQGLEIVHRLPETQDTRQVLAELQHTLGTTYWRMGDYERAIAHIQACIEVRESLGDLYGMSRSYNNLAVVYGSRGDFDLAAQYIRKSLEIGQRIGNAYGTAMCYANLGVVDYTLGNYRRAVEHYERSLAIRQEIGDTQGIADLYNNLGEVHYALGNHREAIYYLQEAIRLFTELGDKATLVEAHKLLAEVELELGDIAHAREHCTRSLALAQEIANQEYEGILQRVLGLISRAGGQDDETIEHLRRSVEILATTGNRLELGRSYYELGLMLKKTGRGGQAELERAAQIFDELGIEGEAEKARAAMR